MIMNTLEHIREVLLAIVYITSYLNKKDALH